MTAEITIAPVGCQDQAIGLHSIPDALAKLKELRLRGELSLPATVWCRGGDYPVREPMLITEQDAMPVTFKAVPGEKPVFDGGYHLTDWQKTKLDGKTVLSTHVPEKYLTDGAITQIHINGRRRSPAIWPKAPAVLTPKGPEDSTRTRLFSPSRGFYLEPGDFDPNWYNPQGIEVLLIQLWTESHLPVEGYDPKTGFLSFRRTIRFAVRPESSRFFYRNVREALTEPGEYYFDHTDNTLYYLPEKGETARNTEAVIPMTGALMVLAGRTRTQDPVQWLGFDGLTFRNGGAGFPRGGAEYDLGDATELPVCHNYFSKSRTPREISYGGSSQAASGMPGVILIQNARNCFFRNCTVERCNWYGFAISGGTAELSFTRNELADLGAGGFAASGRGAEIPDASQDLHHLTICDNHIHDCGQYYLSAVGILLGHVRNSLVEHNHIHDLYYSGISCGWVWGYGENISRENRIGWNRIHDIGKGMLCDMGGIYMLGIQPGTRLYNNLVYQVKCRFYGGWGIYTDEGSSHMVIENNICHDCSRESFHQHYGRENIVRHNIAAFGAENGIAITGGVRTHQIGYGSPGMNYTCNYNFYGNVILVDGTPFYRACSKEAIARDQFFTDLNVLWDLSRKRHPFALLNDKEKVGTFKEWQESGHDRHSDFVDPGFVNPRKRDFHLKKGAYLRKVGFPDPAETLEKAGVREEDESPSC